MVRSNLNSRVFCRVLHHFFSFFLFVPEMLLKLIETFVPEPLVLMHPSRYLPKWFTSKRDKHFTTLLLALDQSCSFEEL